MRRWLAVRCLPFFTCLVVVALGSPVRAAGAESSAEARGPAAAEAVPMEPASGPSSSDAVPVSGVTVRVAASDRYEASRVHRFAFGGGYRDLWREPIELPLLDLEREGGGLTPTRRFGGLQTAVLGFRGADGRAYTFRGTDKDPSAVLSPLLRGTVVQTIVQDQMAAQHPGGPLAAAVVSRAAGVLTVDERLVVMPDDPALGEFRAEFAGMVGSFYEYPMPAGEGRPGFAGATAILDHEDLYARLRESGRERVDAEAFLRARLVDLLIGDFDRHRKQWRWARIPGEEGLQPIPEDRDQAFVRYDGVGQRAITTQIPILQNYDDDYPSMRGLVLHGWEQDRWLLPALDWPAWERVARDVQERLSDDVIAEAVAALPPGYAALDGERLAHDLRGRRDALLEGARAFYDHLVAEVDVRTPDSADRIDVVRDGDGGTTVEVRALDTPADAEPRFRRRFAKDETNEVRIYLGGGDDVVRLAGTDGGTRVRLIADGGAKQIDARAGHVRIYDERKTATVSAGEHTKIVTKPYLPPPPDAGFVDVEDVPPRDWGYEILPLPILGFEDDIGAFIGVGVTATRFGFRKDPFASRHRLSGGYATAANTGRFRYVGQFHPENSKLRYDVEVEASGIEVLRFYGFGNETSDSGSDRFFRVRNQYYQLRPSLRIPLIGHRLGLSVGPRVEYSRTREGDRLIDQLDPYGAGRFGLFSLFAKLRYDTRRTIALQPDALVLPLHDNPAAGFPARGVLFDFGAQVTPGIWDVERTYGRIKGSLAGYYGFGERAWLTFAGRIGGEHNFGQEPYFDSAFIGGGRTFSGDATIRGYRAQRFAGDASVYANLDVRLRLGTMRLLVPAEVGLLAFADVGRVFELGASSKQWHEGYGGGLWIAPLARTNAISFSVADSPEDTIFYLRMGFHF